MFGEDLLMLTFLAIFHFIVALALILLVIIQDSKGGAMGGVFGGGGGGNSVLSSTGATNLLVKLTRWLAITFAATCILLTYYTANKSSSVVDGYIPPATQDGGAGLGAKKPADDKNAVPAKTDAKTPEQTPEKKQDKNPQDNK